ncbi:MAG: ABC transporter substrate-binding protein [Sporomusaceae bacterium]|nr:ABC transporter substrate-binding protein [Sporomusaceae bacterium]
MKNAAIRNKISVILCLVFVLAAAAGCGGQTPAKPASNVVNIEYWHINSQSFGGPAVAELIKLFNEKNPDVKVTEKFHPNVYTGLMQNLQAALAAGNPPAVAQIGYNYVEYASNSFPFFSIDDAAKLDAADKDYLKSFLPNVLALAQVKGKQVGLPYSVSNPVMYINSDLVAKAGLDPQQPPKTWKELQAAARIVKEKTGAFGLYVQEAGDNWTQQGLMESNGARILKQEDGKFKAAFNSPQSIAVYQELTDLVLQDKAALHATTEEGFQAFAAGKVAYYIGTIARRAAVESAAKFKVAGAPFPVFGDNPRRIPAGGNSLFIFAKDPEQQKAAWKFIKFLNSPEALAIWIKGTGYLPPRSDVSNTPALKPILEDNSIMKAATAQMDAVVPWVNFPGANGLQAEKALVDARDAILGGNKAPAAALKDAEDKVNSLIK